MPAENVHHRKGKKKYTVVLIPGDEAEKTKSFSVDRIGAAALLLVSFFAIIAIGAVAILYTPVGNLVPIPAPKLEQTYGRQIAQIQDQVNHLLQEMGLLRNYNVRLRRALGENVATSDSGADTAGASRELTVAIPSMPQRYRDERSARNESTVASTAANLSSAGPGLPSGDAALRQDFEPRDVFPFTLPADGFVTRTFDVQQQHYGVDIAGKRGSGVVAAADGSVVFAGWTYDDGFMIMVSHSQGYLTVYKHNDKLLKSTGASVKRGEVIALLGNTGRTSSGPHLHFEVWKNGKAYNPDNYLLITQ